MSANVELDDELSTARRALDGGDAKHAQHHLANAFALAPLDERVAALFESLAHGRDLTGELPDGSFYGAHLVRAHALRRAGRLDDAASALAQIAEQMPDRGFETVLAGWLVALDAEGRRLGEEASQYVARMLVAAGGSTIGLHRLLPGERALLAGFGEVADAFARCGTGATCAAASAGMLRRVGRCAEALALVEGAHLDADEHALIQRGLALRAMGEGARAADVFARAAGLDPADTKHRIEQARSWFVAGDFARARELLASLPSTRDPELARLSEEARVEPAGDRLEALDRIRREGNAPPLELPRDATANALRNPELKPGMKLRMAVSGWESPSNRLLAALYATRATDVSKVDYELTSTSEMPFDPLAPRRGGAPPLWVRRAELVAQGPAEPARELCRALAAVAADSASFDAMVARAEALASTLDAARAPDVAAAMVYPPADDDAWLASLPVGLYRYQVACALVIGALPAWSVARPILASLAFGPVDWTSGAAITALAERARRDPAAAHAAHALLLEVVADLLPHSCEPRFAPLAHALSTLPCVPQGASNALSDWWRTHMESEEAPPAPSPRAAPSPERAPARRAARPADGREKYRVALLVVVVVLLALWAMKRWG